MARIAYRYMPLKGKLIVVLLSPIALIYYAICLILLIPAAIIVGLAMVLGEWWEVKHDTLIELVDWLFDRRKVKPRWHDDA